MDILFILVILLIGGCTMLQPAIKSIENEHVKKQRVKQENYVDVKQDYYSLYLAEKVKPVIMEVLGVSDTEITPEAYFVDDLGMDSLDAIELRMSFEEAFDIQISDEEAGKIVTVKDAINYIAHKW